MSRRSIARCLLCCIFAACGDAPDERVPTIDDYPITRPSPIQPARSVPLERARFRIVATDVQYEVDGTRVFVGRIGTTLDARGPGDMELFEVDAQRIRNGQVEWRIASDALRVADLRLTGDARGATFLPARLVVQLPGRPRMSGLLSGSVSTDADDTLRGSGTLAFGASSLAGSGAMASSGQWHVTLRMNPLALDDAHAFVDAVPAHGVARGSLVVSGGGGALRARSGDGIVVTTDRSELRMTGAVARAPSGLWSFERVAIALDPVHPDDWRVWLGSDPLVDAPTRGRLLANGSGREGIDVSGWILSEDSAGSRLAADVDGALWLEPELRLDAAIESRSLRLAGAGPLDLDVHLSGGMDSLAVVGSARLSVIADSPHPLLSGLPRSMVDRFGTGALRIDASVIEAGGALRATGIAEVVDSAGRVWVSLRGSAPLDGNGALDVTAFADSLPLALLPRPGQVKNLEGYARVRARAAGTVAAPALVADAELIDFRFEVPEYGTGVDSMRARVRLAGERFELVDVRAFRGDGSLSLFGGVRFGGPLDLRDPGGALDGATLDVIALLDTMTVIDIDSARAVVTGRIVATGPLRRPHAAGRVELVEGHVFEGKLAPNPPLDPEDPPYSDLAASAPWPSGRLSAAAAREASDTSPASAPPLTADLTFAVRPAFRIIDEDSDLGALGGIRLIIDERGAHALGDARIIDGFYAYYGEIFQLTGGAFAVDGRTSRLAMSGELRGSDRPLGLGQGGHDGLDRRDPPIGIFGYSTPATVLELLRRRTPLPATQPELASLLLFDVPTQAVDAFEHELIWRGDEPDDLVGHRSAIQGSGLLWSYIADELYDYVPIASGNLRAGTVRIGSRYPGWIMLGTQLEAAVHVGDRLTARATHVVGGETWPGLGLRFALRDAALEPAHRHIEVFNEPRFSTSLGTSGPRPEFEVRRRTGLRVRWLWDY